MCRLLEFLPCQITRWRSVTKMTSQTKMAGQHEFVFYRGEGSMYVSDSHRPIIMGQDI